MRRQARPVGRHNPLTVYQLPLRGTALTREHFYRIGNANILAPLIESEVGETFEGVYTIQYGPGQHETAVLGEA